ncbi:MAG TPA: STAS domain-containing protein, partial [Chloroflexota bacterium]|nr:STAS domain-containing protein [Chloroflexota bacterium]
MPRVPIIRIEDILIASVQEELADQDAIGLETDLGNAIEGSGARGVLLDLSVVETVDSFLGRVIDDIARLARLLGAQTVVVGVQPAVAITIMELGLQLKGVPTALNADKGMAML